MTDDMWTSFPGLVDSLSPPAPTDLKPLPSASTTPSAETSSAAPGPASRVSKTCGRRTSDPLPDLFSCQEGHPASLQAAPGSSEARMMTAGSGRTLFERFPRSGPLGRCMKTLLALETWASPEFLLKWQASGTKQGCLVYRLVPSVPRIGASGTGSWPTPRKSDITNGRTNEMGPAPQLRDYVRHQIQAWPTPDASEAGKTSRGGDRVDEPLIGGLLRGTWPTPRSEDSESTGAHRGTPDTLTSAAKAAWATPNASDGSGGGMDPARRVGHTIQIADQSIGPISSGLLARIPSFGVRLMVLSAWLMGMSIPYLLNWPKRTDRSSGRSEMESSGKSRAKSSPQS